MSCICGRCLYPFLNKSRLIAHLKIKTKCDVIEDGKDISCDILLKELIKPILTTGYPCKKCGKFFKTPQNRYKHEKHNCNEDNDIKKNTQNIIQEDNKLIDEKNNTNNIIQNVIQENKKLINQLKFLKLDKTESFYQKHMEKYLKGEHLKVRSGITDVSTDLIHAELKLWSNYKDSIGQLLCYNIDKPRKELHVYLFGSYVAEYKKNAIEKFVELNIKPFDMVLTDNGFNIIDCITNKIVNQITLF